MTQFYIQNINLYNEFNAISCNFSIFYKTFTIVSSRSVSTLYTVGLEGHLLINFTDFLYVDLLDHVLVGPSGRLFSRPLRPSFGGPSGPSFSGSFRPSFGGSFRPSF